MDIST
ncbi:hypothetical protein LINGRAHAP2_LOCUS17100 [Linum grandiflorum]